MNPASNNQITKPLFSQTFLSTENAISKDSLFHIFSYLESAETFHSIGAIGLTCKYWHKLETEFLNAKQPAFFEKIARVWKEKKTVQAYYLMKTHVPISTMTLDLTKCVIAVLKEPSNDAILKFKLVANHYNDSNYLPNDICLEAIWMSLDQNNLDKIKKYLSNINRRSCLYNLYDVFVDILQNYFEKDVHFRRIGLDRAMNLIQFIQQIRRQIQICEGKVTLETAILNKLKTKSININPLIFSERSIPVNIMPAIFNVWKTNRTLEFATETNKQINNAKIIEFLSEEYKLIQFNKSQTDNLSNFIDICDDLARYLPIYDREAFLKEIPNFYANELEKSELIRKKNQENNYQKQQNIPNMDSSSMYDRFEKAKFKENERSKEEQIKKSNLNQLDLDPEQIQLNYCLFSSKPSQVELDSSFADLGISDTENESDFENDSDIENDDVDNSEAEYEEEINENEN